MFCSALKFGPELKMSMDEHISTVISGFGQLGTYVAEELPRLIMSRDAQILAVQDACRALHANQKVLTGILKAKGGLMGASWDFSALE